MDVDNENAREDFRQFITEGYSGVEIPNIITESLSGVVGDVKWYAKSYYSDVLWEYVDMAKNELSGATNMVKDYYNDSVDQVSNNIIDKVSQVISEKLNTLKLK